MKTVMKILVISAMTVLAGCKSQEEKLAEKMAACEGDSCTEIMKELVQLPLEKQLAVSQLMKLDTAYQKKIAKEKIGYINHSAEWYRKLQQAYFEELQKIGTFENIGYAPNRDDEFGIDESDNALEIISLTDLANCPKNSKWKFTPEIVGKELKFRCSIYSTNRTACVEISSNFMSLCD